MSEGSLASLKEVTRAAVFKNGELAAHLTRGEAGTIVFAYTDGWVSGGGPAVATTLPVRPEPVVTVGGAVPAFFAGLLPEGRRLTALRQGVKTSADDELSQLLAIGGDTIGDVRVVPDGRVPVPVEPRLAVTTFAAVSFADLLATMGVHVDRVGLPGVQDKVSAAMLNLPVTAAGAHTLLKLDPPEFPHLVANEHFFLGAARRAGIRVVDAALVHDGAGVPALAVSRFDRLTVDAAPAALPVEDGCQVLGLHPAEKYRVSTEELFQRLSQVCEAPLPAAAEYLAQIAFAYLTGNGDAHAKNFSVLRDRDGRWQPTPAYDLPSTFFYDDHTMALPVDGLRQANIPRARFLALAAGLGLPERAAGRILDRIARSADSWLDDIDVLPFDPGRLTKFKRVVAHRQRMLRSG